MEVGLSVFSWNATQNQDTCTKGVLHSLCRLTRGGHETSPGHQPWSLGVCPRASSPCPNYLNTSSLDIPWGRQHEFQNHQLELVLTTLDDQGHLWCSLSSSLVPRGERGRVASPLCNCISVDIKWLGSHKGRAQPRPLAKVKPRG